MPGTEIFLQATGECPKGLLRAILSSLLGEKRADADGPQTALKLKQLEGVWTVYSVGPNGNDDGGPPPDGTEPDHGNDDIGLALQR